MQKIASQNPHQKLHKMTIHKHDGDSDGIGTQVPAGNWIGEAMAQRPLSTAPRCRMLGAHRSRSTWNQIGHHNIYMSSTQFVFNALCLY